MANNLNSIMETLMSSDALKGIEKASGINVDDVTKVLSNTLPSLLSGANKQTKNNNTAASFASALENHGSKDVNDLLSFFKNVDISDGAKIVGHLLGDDKDKTVVDAAKTMGIDEKTVSSVMSSAAPLLMSLLGKSAQENKKDNKGSTIDVASSLLGNIDVGDLLKKFIK